MKKILVMGVVIAVGIGLVSKFHSKPTNEVYSDYILQGAMKATIVDDVNSVGGIVVQEYSLIEAVSVKLSDSQRAEIKKMNPMIRFFEDQSINVSSVTPSHSDQLITFNVKARTAIWEGSNSGSDTVLIDSINLNMPSENRTIKSITVNGSRISAKTIALNGTITLQDSEKVELSPGEALKVEVSFAKLKTTNQSDYQIEFSQTSLSSTTLPDDGSSAKEVVPEMAVAPAKIDFRQDSNEITWVIDVSDINQRTLKGIKLRYPEANLSVSSMNINDRDISFKAKSDTELKFTKSIGLVSGENINIRIGFENLSALNNESYQMALVYSDDIVHNVAIPATSYALGKERDTGYPKLVKANLAHEIGITGYGVTVAIIDTGLRDLIEIKSTATNGRRNITQIDVLDSTLADKKNKKNKKNDENGHGTHLASIITNSSERVDENGNFLGGYNGIAPDVNLVVVKAFDDQGQSSYQSILNALEYVVENKDVHNIKVLNLSFSAIPSSYYWDDPLNQALMKAWEAGITVVAAAGNRGPDAMTIGVPGNTPYVITVGAISDNYTPNNMNDDFVASFSSAGPTYEGFVKPELVAPGGHIQGIMDKFTLVRKSHPVFEDVHEVIVTVTDPISGEVSEVITETDVGLEEHNYFEMSGSSQSTAVTTGIIALMLQANPSLTPDDIKCRLIETAKAATTENGQLAFSIFQQGAGLVDAMAAIESTATGCANADMSIAKDLSGEEHYIGPVRLHENETDFYIPGIEGLEWSGDADESQRWRMSSLDASQSWLKSSFNGESQLWNHTSFDSNSQLWRNRNFNADSQLWRNRSFDIDSQLWRNRTFDTDSQLWRNRGFDTDSQLWRNRSFRSDSLSREWVEHE